MGGTVVGDMLRTLADTAVLMAADWRENLAATEQGRGAIDKSRRALERIRHDRVNPDIGMVGLAGLHRGRKGLSPSPPSEPCWRFSRTRLSSRWFPHRDWLACT
jgi:hypothetical protein